MISPVAPLDRKNTPKTIWEPGSHALCLWDFALSEDPLCERALLVLLLRIRIGGHEPNTHRDSLAQAAATKGLNPEVSGKPLQDLPLSSGDPEVRGLVRVSELSPTGALALDAPPYGKVILSDAQHDHLVVSIGHDHRPMAQEALLLAFPDRTGTLVGGGLGLDWVDDVKFHVDLTLGLWCVTVFGV